MWLDENYVYGVCVCVCVLMSLMLFHLVITVTQWQHFQESNGAYEVVIRERLRAHDGQVVALEDVQTHQEDGAAERRGRGEDLVALVEAREGPSDLRKTDQQDTASNRNGARARDK